METLRGWIKWINKKFREWTSSYPDIQFVVIPGNHDFYPIAHILYRDVGIDWKYAFSPNVHFLGDAAAEIGGVRFYGTPWVPISLTRRRTSPEATWIDLSRLIPNTSARQS